MGRIASVLLALALFLTAFGALAEDEQVAMRIVSCPEQGFSTLCKPEYDYEFVPDGGLTLYLGEEDGAACVTIFKTDAPGADFDSEYYLNNVFPRTLENSYGDDLISIGDYTVYSLGGRRMPGRMALYQVDGEGRMRFCAMDLREEYFVQYEAFSRQVDAEMEAALKALAVAVGNFQPDADYYYNHK